jgi:hypothetical protein
MLNGGSLAEILALCDPAPQAPSAPEYADLEAGSLAQVPIMPQGQVRAARAYDPADGGARDHALRLFWVHPDEER